MKKKDKSAMKSLFVYIPGANVHSECVSRFGDDHSNYVLSATRHIALLMTV